MRPLTPKQARFVDEYLVDLNATQAAIRAGYAPKDADVQGPRLLGNVGIAAAVARAQAERSARIGLTAERVLEELSRLAFSDMGDFAEWSEKGVALRASGGLDTRCVLEVKETSKQFGSDVGIKLHDKVAALKLVGQHLGLFPDRHEVTGKDGAPLVIREVVVHEPSARDSIA